MLPVIPSPGAAAEGGQVARRSRPIYRVFVSSTWVDLQPERRALMEALNRMEEMRFVGMEFFGNRPDDTHDASIDQVDLCEVFVGIIGFRYGSGITEAEYRRARALNLPCFVYFKREESTRPELTDGDAVLAAKLTAFRQELRRGHTVKEVGSPEELAASATADLHNWVAARWISVERDATASARPPAAVPDADHTNVLRLLERIEQDWIKGVLEASLHHKAWLELGLDWREDAVEHPWDRIVVAPNRPIQTLSKEDSITGVFDAAHHTLLVLGEPGAGKTTTVLELARDLIARARASAHEPAPVVLALSTWRGQHKDLMDWLVAELGLRYQVPKRVARTWLEEGRLVLILDGLDEVVAERRAACVDAINAFEQEHHPRGLAVTCRVAEYNALTTKLRLRSAICLQPLTPTQIDRYFQAAGASLDPLRRALQDDVGLRELARSPLMLSVMTMAWRDAPAGTTAPAAPAQKQEERRRQLFDAYVQAALHRRGKASGGYTPEQTIKWLTWLARRMKEQGHTLFALEQLQPGWLDGAWRQFGYFVTSRLLGTVGLLLPFMIFLQVPNRLGLTLALPGLALLAGCYIGTMDFAFAMHGWGGPRRAVLRFLSLLGGLLFLSFGWMGLSPFGGVGGGGALYLFMVMLAFCAPVDVRALDIKPAGSMQWSWRLAIWRGLTVLGVITVIVTAALLIAVTTAVGDRGWAQGWTMAGGAAYLMGLALGGIAVVAGWRRWRPGATLENGTRAATLVLFSGQIGGALGSIQTGDVSFWRWGAVMGEMWPVILFGVFGGFGSTLIDPTRPQQAGAWFWLRVPVLAFFVVGGIMLVPGMVLMALSWSHLGRSGLSDFTAGLALFSAGCGLVAFLRFGGFNGVQHFLLRWLLARSGHLPPRPEAFLNHATQLALLQKVGLGYRFVHALLLLHLAAPRDGAGEGRGAGVPTGGTIDESAGRWPRVTPALRVVAWLGLGTGLAIVVWMAAAGFALDRAGEGDRSLEVLSSFLGILMGSVALALPALLLTGRWLASRSWLWLGGGWLGLGLLFAWLARDEPGLRYPAGLPETAMVQPGTEGSHAVLLRLNQLKLRYGRIHPVTKTFRWDGLNFYHGPEQGEIWREFLKAHRAEIEDNWAALAPVSAWLEDLNSFAQFADLGGDPGDGPASAHLIWHTYAQNAMAMAGLQALDGRGDEALAMLLPMLEAGGKLEEGARELRNLSLARVMQHAAVRAADFVLDTAPPSPQGRARFAAALAARGGGPAGARRIYAIRYAVIRDASDSFGRAITVWERGMFDFMRPPLDVLGPVAFNRRASLNRWGELFAALQESAARREPEQARQRVAEFIAQEGRPRFKNVGMSWVTWLSSDQLGLKHVAEQQKGYWADEDKRAALLARLVQP